MLKSLEVGEVYWTTDVALPQCDRQVSLCLNKEWDTKTKADARTTPPHFAESSGQRMMVYTLACAASRLCQQSRSKNKNTQQNWHTLLHHTLQKALVNA
jgi:hypothetical protein